MMNCPQTGRGPGQVTYISVLSSFICILAFCRNWCKKQLLITQTFSAAMFVNDTQCAMNGMVCCYTETE